MRRARTLGLAASGAAAALALAACGGGSGGGAGSSSSAGYNASLTKVVDHSSHKGGTLTFGDSGTPDSTDPGNTYYPFMWNLTRLYTMPLMTYKSCPGQCGLQVVPDLATRPGTVTDNGLTWTYQLQRGVKFEDGTTVTSQDVKYAVERTFDRSVLPNGPSYFQVLLGGNAATYPGPYQNRSKNLMGLTAVQTPDATTIVFHLAHRFADFNSVVAIPQTAPVPPKKDTGPNYQLHPMSTGPYKFQSYQLNKQLTMVPNQFWKASTDPNARQLVSKVVINWNMNANVIDNRLLAGDLDVDAAGTGVQASARTKILSSAALRASSDDPISGYLRFAYLNTVVGPMNNVHCRMAVEYAANKTSQQTAYGGPVAGGQIASTVAPPNVIGRKQFDYYEATTKPGGDVARARAQLRLCGRPNGFSTGIAYRSDRPKEVQAARSLQASLGHAGIRLSLHGYPSRSYFSKFAGAPTYVHHHHLGILLGSWAADWPGGYGFFGFITAGDTISPAGNINIAELNDPKVNGLLTKMASTNDATTRNSRTAQIDRRVMKDAAILPEVYAKSLLYRSPNLTNVYVQSYYGMYNYAVLGLK
ncbi:MAG: peptide/nickel transport system substrate-binding protein [Streptosporangiaceae bacterium]|nr:peptide/nickel transport system substrate-binding protein [Streptosporangiaceae bacterium]